MHESSDGFLINKRRRGSSSPDEPGPLTGFAFMQASRLCSSSRVALPDIQINDDTEMIAGPYSTVALTERKGGRADAACAIGGASTNQ